jgi:phosphate starvation-inducible protein PhoH
MIFCGDDSGLQTDIKKGMTGMTYLTKIISKYNIEDTSVIEFTPADIVRSGITKSFVLAFESEFHLDKNGKGILAKQ